MKTSNMKPKAFIAINQEIRDLHDELFALKDVFSGDWDCEKITQVTKDVKVLEDFREANCEIVNVNFSIGSRDYNKKAYKVGKSLYTCTGLTKLTAYFSPEIIPEITEQMIQDSISDSYYY